MTKINKDTEILRALLRVERSLSNWYGESEDKLVSDLVDEIMDIYRAEMLDAEELTGKASIMPVEDRENYVREKLEENFSDLPSRVKNEVVEGALKENWDYHKGGWNDYKWGASI